MTSAAVCGPHQVTALILWGHSTLPGKAQFSRANSLNSTSTPNPEGPVFRSLLANLWDSSWWEHVCYLCGRWQMQVLPKESQPRLLIQFTVLTLWPLCSMEKRLLITGSCFLCAFGEMGNKRMKGTHWGKTTSGLNWWRRVDDGITGQVQITWDRNSCKRRLSL